MACGISKENGNSAPSTHFYKESMQKLLFTLTIVWCALTINLAISNYLYIEDAEFQADRRAFLVYSRTLSGCMVGAYYGNSNYDFTPMYIRCLNLAQGEKAAYISDRKK